jgi:hypothetical protein
MDPIDNLRRDFLRLADRVRVSLQIHVGDTTRYRQLRNDVMDFLNAAGQVGSQMQLSDKVSDLTQHQNQLPVDDYRSLQDSVSKMIECLRTAEIEAMDPPAPGLQVSNRVKGRVGRPRVEIDKNFLENALKVRGPHQLAKVMKCSPRTIRRRALEYGLVDEAPPVFQTFQNPDGTVSQTWHSSSTPSHSAVAEDPDALDELVRAVLHTFPNVGRQKLDGMLKARDYSIPREKLRESYVRVHGAPARFARPQIERRSYYVPAPNSLWHHDGNHSKCQKANCQFDN